MKTKLALFAIIPNKEKGDKEVYWCDIGRKLRKFPFEDGDYIYSGDIIRVRRIDNNEKVIGILDGGGHINIREGWLTFCPIDYEALIRYKELYPGFRFGDFIVKEIPVNYKDNIEDGYEFGRYRYGRRMRLEQERERAKSKNKQAQISVSRGR